MLVGEKGHAGLARYVGLKVGLNGEVDNGVERFVGVAASGCGPP